MADYEWSCPSCTFFNKAGSFKCSVCGTPKGTATRQVKFHMSALEQQYVAESFQSINRLQGARSSNKLQNQTINNGLPRPSSNGTNIGVSGSSSGDFSGPSSSSQYGSNQLGKRKLRARGMYGRTQLENKWPYLPNLDRHSKRDCHITVDNVTVTITEYDSINEDSSPV